jgi:hypothetical protein
VHGNGGRDRLLTLPRHADQAVEEWLGPPPLAVRAGSSWARLPTRHCLPPSAATTALSTSALRALHFDPAQATPRAQRRHPRALRSRRPAGAESHYLALVDGDRDALVEALDLAASSRR